MPVVLSPKELVSRSDKMDETVLGYTHILYEPLHEKTCLRGFRPGPAQTRLLNYRRVRRF